MDKNNKTKVNNPPRPRADRGTYDKEKNSERNRWKKNLKNYMSSSGDEDEDDFEEFE
jgi:hypothetical protein